MQCRIFENGKNNIGLHTYFKHYIVHSLPSTYRSDAAHHQDFERTNVDDAESDHVELHGRRGVDDDRVITFGVQQRGEVRGEI